MTKVAPHGTLPVVSSTDWQSKVDFMRANGIITATWEAVYAVEGQPPSETLSSCTLGPAVATPSTEQSDTDPSDLAKKEAAQRARTYFAAGGGVVPRASKY